MEITFTESSICDLCCCRERLVQRYGSELGKKICSRLSLLSAARSLDDLPSTPPVSFTPVDGAGLYSVALGDQYRLLFKSVMSALKRGPAGSLRAEIEIIGPVPNSCAKGQQA